MRRLIRTDGTSVDYDEPIPVSRFRELIGAAETDHVTLRHLPGGVHVMFCDGLGYDAVPVEHVPREGEAFRIELKCTRARKPVNIEATKHYHANCMPGTTHQIVGDVLIVPDADYDH